MDNIIKVHKKRSYEPGITLFSMTPKEITSPCSKGFCFPGLLQQYSKQIIYEENANIPMNNEEIVRYLHIYIHTHSFYEIVISILKRGILCYAVV